MFSTTLSCLQNNFSVFKDFSSISLSSGKKKNTVSKTQRAVSLLTEFLRAKNETRKVEEIPEELNGYISEFIVAVTVGKKGVAECHHTHLWQETVEKSRLD